MKSAVFCSGCKLLQFVSALRRCRVQNLVHSVAMWNLVSYLTMWGGGYLIMMLLSSIVYYLSVIADAFTQQVKANQNVQDTAVDNEVPQ